MNDYNYDNEIIEIGEEKEEVVDFKEEKPKKEKKRRKSLKEFWSSLSKKKKIACIVISVLILLLIALLLVYLFVLKDKAKKPKEEQVIVEKDNYRYENGKLVFLDLNERKIGEYECKVKDANNCLVTKLQYTTDNFERIKSLYEDGTEVEKTSSIFHEKYVFIEDFDSLFLYNFKDNKNELTIKSVKIYNSNRSLAVIEDENSRFGLIEIKEDGFEFLIRPSYDNLGIINTKLNYLVAKDKDELYIVDATGKRLSKNILNANPESVNEKYIVATKNNGYYLYDYDFNELLSDYDYITVIDSIVCYVDANRLYLKDQDLNNLMEDGIRLDDTNYIKSYIYDKTNKLIETKKSFDLSISDNVATVTVGTNNEVINLLDGVVSSKYAYMSYFENKLYFYSDIEKEDVIGTYTCNNKNNIKGKDSILDVCSIYNTGENFSGIYNNDYVFLTDYSGVGDKLIYLYSLKDKKIKGTYQEIEFINADELSNEMKLVYTSASHFVAKAGSGNNRGNYGVIEINSEKVVGKIPFNSASITKETIGNMNYYIVTNLDKQISIYNNVFTKVSDDFDYIKLYDNYYVGIIGNKLNVYSYLSNKPILEENLDVVNNDYKINFANGFNITIKDVEYNYTKEGKKLIQEPIEQEIQNSSANSEENNEG